MSSNPHSVGRSDAEKTKSEPGVKSMVCQSGLRLFRVVVVLLSYFCWNNNPTNIMAHNDMEGAAEM